MPSSFRRTRIVATIGPACDTWEKIKELVEAGVNVFRLNFSHGAREDHRQTFEIIRSIGNDLGTPVGILQDLQGPKIRVGRFENDRVKLLPGRRFDLICGEVIVGNERRASVSYDRLHRDLVPGDTILLDDGRLSIEVETITGDTVQTKVVSGGTLSNNKGVNIPSANLSIPALTQKDIKDLKCGAELGIDWVAMSFVRSRDDLLMARKYLQLAGSTAKLMAKIEKPGAVDQFKSILEEVDGIMVARGDLGVELSAEKVPIIQKRLIHMSRKAGKPVVTATQMLETMVDHPYPTRAEASDVANAIYDGTDAIMLSAETAIGKNPLEAVNMMVRIARSVESDSNYRRTLRKGHPNPKNTIADAVSLAACEMAYSLNASIIVTFSSTGLTVSRVSRNRFPTPILAYTTSARTYHQLSLSWGVIPVLGEELQSSDQMVELANRAILDAGVAEPGSNYVITAGVPFGVVGTTNMIRIETVEESIDID